MGTDNAGMELIASGLQFPEGPIWLRDGRILVVEIKTGTLAAVSPDGTVERVATTGGGPERRGRRPRRQGLRLQQRRLRVVRASTASSPRGRSRPTTSAAASSASTSTPARSRTSTPRSTATRCAARTTSCSTPTGGFYFTDLGKSRAREVDKAGVYYADAATARRSASSPTGSTTPTASPCPRTAATSTSPRRSPGACGRGTIAVAGRARPPATPGGHGTLLYSFDGYQLLDSMAVDGAGNVCVATLHHGCRERRRRPTASCSTSTRCPEPDPLVTNVCFGGDGYETAFVTSSGRGLLYKMDVAARRPPPALRALTDEPAAPSSWPVRPASSATPRSSSFARSAAGT